MDVKRPGGPLRRSPSPLRNSYTAGSESGSEDGSDEEEGRWSHQSQSPSPSITKFATNLVRGVGQLVNNGSSRNLPTDAELEAEAERERERSRREAEMIMRREAEERKLLEDRVMQMFEDTPNTFSPSRPRAQTMPTQGSPTPSQKEKEGWFTAVKNRLTPTKEKELLTPAQQIIQETKAKDKEKKKDKGKGKEVEKDQKPEWPATPSRKYSDPAFLNLAQSASPELVTPPRPIGQNGYMTPSPGRSVDSNRDGPPLYAQFNEQGVLDVPDTLLTIARRFEKLEKWTVSHVRALETRMEDVERWLADKEEKEKEEKAHGASEKSSFHSEEDDEANNNVAEIREELIELQGRVGELGREMAKLMTSPLNLTTVSAKNTVAAQQSQQPVVPPTPSSIAPRTLPALPPVMTPRQTMPTPQRPADAPSPPSATTTRSASVLSNGSGRTRLPYPTGDYTSPPGSIPIKQEILSPTNSPPSSLNNTTRQRPLSIAGLPSAGSSYFQSSSGPSTPGLPQRQETPVRALSPKSPSSSAGSPRQTNISPTPRKRYTVALGAPITGHSAPDSDEEEPRRGPPDSDVFESSSIEGDMHEISHSRESTIGKSDKSESHLANSPAMPNDTFRRGNSTGPNKNSPARARAQSSYGPPRGFDLSQLGHGIPSSSPAPITPLRLRVRSKSIDRVGLGIGTPSPAGSGKFVDPLLLRKQEQESLLPRTSRTPIFERGKKLPVNELVAYFEKDKQR